MKSETTIVAIAASMAVALLLSVANAGEQCCGWTGKALAEGAVLQDLKEPAMPRKPAIRWQTTCPVMGGKINKALYVDAKGHRIYLCCGGCIGKVKADPAKYLAKIKANGETAYKTPKLICSKCGQIKGAKACCSKEAKLCAKCGLHKGSPGCCLIKKGGPNVELCGKCDAIKGSKECCRPAAKGSEKGGACKGAAGRCTKH